MPRRSAIPKRPSRNGKQPATGKASAIEPELVAKAADLVYVSDALPGIKRVHAGRGFRFLRPSGAAVRDAATLDRIHKLVIPPAWTNVWICPSADGHLQATGRDSAGRKQYLYHSRWQQIRDETKFDRLLRFGLTLPKIRRRVQHDLRLPFISRERVLATVVRLLQKTLIRVGNEEYAKTNGSFGLTTLRNRHVEVAGATIHFRFRGKSGIEHTIDLKELRLAKIIRRCQELPGQYLFEYLDEDGRPAPISSSDVNDYLREITGEHFTAKDFRTWYGTVLALHLLCQRGKSRSRTDAQKGISETVKAVAQRLRNTPAVCRRAYIHPAILRGYAEGTLLKASASSTGGKRIPSRGLEDEEIALLRVLTTLDREALGSERPLARALRQSLVSRAK